MGMVFFQICFVCVNRGKNDKSEGWRKKKGQDNPAPPIYVSDYFFSGAGAGFAGAGAAGFSGAAAGLSAAGLSAAGLSAFFAFFAFFSFAGLSAAGAAGLSVAGLSAATAGLSVAAGFAAGACAKTVVTNATLINTVKAIIKTFFILLPPVFI